MVQQISQRTLVLMALAAGALVAGVLFFALWPRGICDLSPCTVNPPGPGEACITVRIIGPCQVTAYTIAAPVVAGFAAAALVMISGIWQHGRRKRGSL